MKNIVIHVHSNNKTIAKHHLDINDKKPLIIQAQPHLNYEFLDAEIKVSPNHIVTKRGGTDLGILLNNDVKDAGIVIIKDFYKYSDNALIGKAENGQYYYYIPDSAEVSDYVTQLADKKSSGLALGGEGFDKPWWADSSKVKTRKSLKSILKSILTDDSSETAHVVEESSSQSIQQPTAKTEKVYNAKTHKFTEVKSEDDGFFDDLDISPWMLGVGLGLGTIALLGSGGGSSDKHSADNEKLPNTKGNDKNNTLLGTDKDEGIDGLAGNDTLDGKAGNDILNGGDGFDKLIGGKGADTLTGGNDTDIFIYKLSDLTDTKTVDTITDFTPKIDKIQLPKELFKADNVVDNLADYIKYNKETGELSYDADGKGGADAVVFATLSNHADLTIDSDTFQII